MGKLLKRFGGQISNVSLDYEVWREMDLNYHFSKMKRYCAIKNVFVIDEMGFGLTSEQWLVVWFKKNYEKLGFEKIAEEQTPEYSKLKEKLRFKKFPDFVALRKGKWLRVEVECFSHQYFFSHDPNYADIVLCYEETKNLGDIEVISLNKVLEVDELIVKGEIPLFLYIYDDEFRQDYDEKMANHVRDMGKMLK